MAEMVETVSTGKTTTRWWTGVLNVQTVLLMGSAFVAIVYFFKDSKDNWAKVKQLEQQMILKSDRAETEAKIRSTDDKVNRQYENNAKITDRIILLEKQSEYERGLHDGIEESKKK